MHYDELAKRLVVVDGIVPRDHILRTYRERDLALRGFTEAIETIRFWQRAAVAMVTMIVFLFGVSVLLMSYGVRQAGMTAGLAKTCIDTQTANNVLTVMDRISSINDSCIALHEKNRELYEDMLAREPGLNSGWETVGATDALYVGRGK